MSPRRCNDSRGYPSKTYAAYYADGAPSKTLNKAADNKVMAAKSLRRSGCVTDTIARTYGDEKYRTTTVYGGDRTTAIPPKGGTATTTVIDARGRTTDRLEYTDAARTSSLKTHYTYGKWDERLPMTDPAGNVWSYIFDARGQQTDVDDPDNKAMSHTTYDKVGNPVTAMNRRGTTLTTDYDKLGRKTKLKKGSSLLAEWTYDTVAKGSPPAASVISTATKHISAVDSYNDTYQPTSTTVTIPAEEGSGAGTYTWT